MVNTSGSWALEPKPASAVVVGVATGISSTIEPDDVDEAGIAGALDGWSLENDSSGSSNWGLDSSNRGSYRVQGVESAGAKAEVVEDGAR
jgi:hypothetical protein